MKNILILFCFIQVSFIQAQGFVNGDFENHPYDACTYNLSDMDFNANVPGVNAFGKAFIGGEFVGEMDVQTFDCYLEPLSGSWCVGLSSDTSAFSDAIALELTTDLEPGVSYELSFGCYSNSEVLNPIEIGISNNPEEFGNSLGTYLPAFEEWNSNTIFFSVIADTKYITVRAVAGSFAWTQVDAFSIVEMGTSTETSLLSSAKIFPNPTSDLLNIELGTIHKEITITLIDVLGKELFEGTFEQVNQITLDLKNFPSATYILNLQSEGARKSLPIVKL